MTDSLAPITAADLQISTSSSDNSGPRAHVAGARWRGCEAMSLDELAQLWAEDRSVSAISAALNTTKGKVIGAVWRARRAGDERFQPRPPKPKVAQERDRSLPWAGKTRKLKPIDEHVGNSRPLPPAAEPLGPKLLVELPPDRCRFPINDPPPGRGVEMLFCAEPVAQPGENYCGRHAEITRVNSSPSSRFVLRLRSR